MSVMNDFNSYIDKTSGLNKYVSWFSISRIARKLSYAFSLHKPEKTETAKQLDKLCDKEDRWPERPRHAKERDLKLLRAVPEKDYVKTYRRTMVNTVEDMLADICVSLFSLMNKYKKRFESEPDTGDESRNKAYTETFEGKDNFSVCEFLVRTLHNIVHREKDSEDRNRLIDFESVLSFVFWLAVRLGVNSLETYISNRLTYEILRAAESLKKKKTL